MKKIFTALLLGALALSCDNKEIKQTTDSMKSADSLFQTANDGFKTLDSISSIVNDSAKFNRVIEPRIEDTKKSVEQAIRKNAYNLDSLNYEIDKIKKTINNSSEIIKTVDSANKKLREGNVFDKIGTITGTINKISKSKSTTARRDTVATNAPLPPVQEENSQSASVNPLSKNASLEIEVQDIGQSHEALRSAISSGGGEVVTESFTDAEGVKKQYLLAKVPMRNFDAALAKVSNNIGTVTNKAVETEGVDFVPYQMADIAVTLIQDKSSAAIANSSNATNNDFRTNSSAAIKKGANGFEKVMLTILPFWPAALIGGLVWFFVARTNRKKREREMAHQLELERQKNQAWQQHSQNYPGEAPGSAPAGHEQKPNDYSRFMPK